MALSDPALTVAVRSIFMRSLAAVGISPKQAQQADMTIEQRMIE
jgi:hypothetical protein